MNKVTVRDLKETLQEYLDILEQYDDEKLVPTVTNTYFVHSDYFMQYGRTGFIDLGYLDENLEAEDDDDEDDNNTEN